MIARMNPTRNRRGLGLTEVVVLLLVVVVLLLLLILYLPRQRENARLLGCRRNLGQIGLALGVYAQFSDGALPPVPALGEDGPGPISTLLQFWGEPDFSALRVDVEPKPHPAGERPLEHRIAGLVCASNPPVPESFPAPISYRANTGDRADGGNGPFAPGRAVSLREIEEADGLAFTAAFAERLLGDGDAREAPFNYKQLQGPLDPSGCSGTGEWRGDAGATWASARWASALYNHEAPLDATRSCLGGDGTARIIPSSGHIGGVQVLRLDGSVREFKPSVDAKVWRAFGNAFDASGVATAGRPSAASAAGPAPPTTPSGSSEHAGDRP